MNWKPLLSALILPSLLFITAGCELAVPLLIGEATKDDDGAPLPLLTVDVESASGVVAGRTVTPEMFTVTGDHFGGALRFQLLSLDGDLEVFVASQAETSSVNPYTGEGGGEGFSEVTLCEGSNCRNATDFRVELMQTEAGRDAMVDGVWGADESLRLTLHYTESR